jgi:hypothetical protein
MPTPYYSAFDMHQYAERAIESDREQRATAEEYEPVALGYGNGRVWIESAANLRLAARLRAEIAGNQFLTPLGEMLRDAANALDGGR